MTGLDVLDDVVDFGLRVIFCGTAPSRASMHAKAYYAGAGNKFWEILFQTELTPRRFHPHEFSLLLTYGIGLTDIAKSTWGRDAEVVIKTYDRLRLKATIQKFQPKVLAFNGKNAAKAYFSQRNLNYGSQLTSISKTSVFLLPSTSGAANAFWDARPWQLLANFISG